MGLIILAIVCIVLCYIWGNFKNLKEYYPTFLFYFLINLIQYSLTSNKTLWSFKDLFYNDTLADYFIASIIAPCVIIIFLSNYPTKIAKQFVYIFYFVCPLTIVEYSLY